MAAAARSTAPPASSYPCVADDDSAEPLIGYPAVPVEGQPVYGDSPPSLPYHRRRRRCCRCRRGRCCRICACLCCLLVAAIAVAAFFLWPRSLGMSMDDVSLGDVEFQIKREGSIIPSVYLNLTLDLKMEVENPNFFSVTYQTVIVGIYYHDDEIGEAESHGGDLEARSTTTVDSTLELNSNEIASNVLSLLVDVYNDAVPLTITVTFDGHVNILCFKIPLEADVTCSMVINPDNQEILSESCSI